MLAVPLRPFVIGLWGRLPGLLHSAQQLPLDCHVIPACVRSQALQHVRKRATPLSALLRPQASEQPFPSPHHLCCAVYVDGRETARFVPRATDPANGWYSAGNAATQAPFDKPFSVVL